ncbi:gas vesicle protein GvpH [Halalkalicoccus sp. NIPERK01]|uniref:gas vesicle protein GvpH n=1 Tax=Halalkalicoccus sp. NIPERK01 TaxID=3053469 RepID=UPI00256EA17F|nr:gas vesicle protein GvpH [Halalkalicoccus sp. NIPERK01]MDL5363086.1 gas vesicle protein GvpH [Halalkalicoccus sp. NIPERK01]
MTTDDNNQETSSLLDILRHVVETLHDAERSDEGETAGHGTVSGRSFRTDYEFTVSTGLDPDPDSHWGHLGIEELSDESTATSIDTDEGYLVDVREEGDAIIVLADLSQMTAESVTTEIDRERDELVIELGEKTIERIPLDDAAITVTDSTFNNGVLEVRLQTGESAVEGGSNE